MPKKFRGQVLAVDQARIGGGTNYTQIDSAGDISQAATASAALTNTTVTDLKVGGGTSLSAILAGTISPCFNAIAVGASGTGSATITGLTTSHKIFVSPCCLEDISPCLVHISTCPAANKVLIGLQNSASGAQTSSTTCPWAYLAISTA